MSTSNIETIKAKDKPISEDFMYVYVEIEDGGFRKVSKEMLKMLLEGATEEQLAQIEQNKNDIGKLSNTIDDFTVEGEVPINICNEVYEYGIFHTDGTKVYDGQNYCFRTATFLKVEGGRTIEAFFGNNNFNGATPINVVEYNSDKEIIVARTTFYAKKWNGNITGDEQQPKELTLNNETSFIHFSLCPWDNVGALEDLQVGLYYVEDGVEDYLPCSETKQATFLNAEKIKGLSMGNRKLLSNVESMIANTDLTVGDVCETLGYLNNGDGGGAVYNIVSEVDATTHQIPLANGLYASLIHDGTINVKQLGAVCDASTDNHDVFQKAFDIATRAVIIPSGKYQLKSSVNVSGKNNFSIYAQDSIINYWNNGTYAFRFTNISNCTFKFGDIWCWNNGCGIEIYSEDYNNPVQYINVYFNSISSDVNCFYLHVHEGVTPGQVNEVRFFNGRVKGYNGTAGVGFKLINYGGGVLDHFVFSSVGIEGVDTGFYLEGLQEHHPSGAMYTYCRMLEITNCRMCEAFNTLIETVGFVSHIKIDTSTNMRSNYFKFSEKTKECYINGSITDVGYGTNGWLLYVTNGIAIPQSLLEDEIYGELWDFNNEGYDKFKVPKSIIVPETMRKVTLTNQYGVNMYGLNDIQIKFKGVNPDFKLLDHNGNVIFDNVSAVNAGDTLRFKWGEYSGWTVEKLNTIPLTTS